MKEQYACSPFTFQGNRPEGHCSGYQEPGDAPLKRGSPLKAPQPQLPVASGGSRRPSSSPLKPTYALFSSRNRNGRSYCFPACKQQLPSVPEMVLHDKSSFQVIKTTVRTLQLLFVHW